MSHYKEGVNPLRPYYIPPSIGEEPIASETPAPRPSSLSPAGGPNATGRYASRARDILSDIDYKDYLSDPSPSAVQTLKDLIDELLWKYTSVLMAQPFDVAKTILQIRAQDDPGALGEPSAPIELSVTPRQPAHRGSVYGDLPDSDSDPDEPAYFTSNLSTPTPSYPRSRSQRQRQASTPPSPKSPSKPAPPPAHQLALRRPDSVLEVISQIWQKEGAWGVWKGSNATFVYTVLQSLLENWSRSLLSALFNVPDLGVKDDLDRMVDIAFPYPWASLFVAAAAAVATGLILAPLDLARTRLIVTPVSRPSRRMFSTLRSLPSYLCPSSLFFPTVLHSLVHPLLTLSTPLALRTRFMIDREASPMAFSIAKFCSSSVALFIKLPLETVLRRGQVAVLASPAYLAALDGPAAAANSNSKGRRLGGDQLEAIVEPGTFDGVLGTMHAIVSREGSRPVPPGSSSSKASRGLGSTPGAKGKKGKVAETVYRRGQGPDGLWRGWKVSWWGLVGLWTAGVVGGGGDGEF